MTPKDHRISAHGTRYSAIPIMSLEGIHDICLFEGTVNVEKFEDFISSCLAPIVQPFNPLSVVIMDNALIHHVENVTDLIENQSETRLLFLPSYSPDLNPIEEVSSKSKLP